MSRRADETRKPALLEQILEYLLDKPLSTLSFRTLAKALDVSTFTLVYHFGTRAELIRDIVAAISDRADDIEIELQGTPTTIESYLLGQIKSWEWSVQPRNMRLQLLEFEAAILEAHDAENPSFTSSLYQRWYEMGRVALVELGLSQEDAAAESRLAVDVFFGLQYDLVVNRDIAAATAAFERSIEVRRERLEQMLAAAP